MSLNRAASGLVAAVYVIYAFSHFPFMSAAKFSVGLVVLLLCIWFPEAMGGDMSQYPSRSFTNPSPPGLVWLLGWILLLIPAMLWIVGPMPAHN